MHEIHVARTRGTSRHFLTNFFSIFIFLFFVIADCKQAAPEYKHTTRIYTRIIDIRALEGKLYAFPRYVRRREHAAAAEEDLQPRKLYYSGRLGQSRPAVENKDCRNKGFFYYLFFFRLSFIIRLLHFRYNTPIYPCIVRVYIRVFFVIHQGRSKNIYIKKTRTNEHRE